MCHKGQQPLIDEPIVCYVHHRGEVWYPTRGSPKDNILLKWREPLHIVCQGKLLWFFHWHREDVFRFLSLYYFGRYRLVFFTWHEQPKISQLDFPSQANNLLVQMILILEIRLLLLFQVMGEFNRYKSSMTFNPILYMGDSRVQFYVHISVKFGNWNIRFGFMSTIAWKAQAKLRPKEKLSVFPYLP
jgi:hypothetical protein